MSTTLDGELAKVLAAVDRIETALSASPINRPALAEARCALAATLAGHFAFKETLYDRMRSVGGHSVEETVRRSRARSLALVVAYRFHLADWSADAITADPDGYRDDARGLIVRTRALAAFDAAALAPLLEALIEASPLLVDLRIEPCAPVVPAA